MRHSANDLSHSNWRAISDMGLGKHMCSYFSLHPFAHHHHLQCSFQSVCLSWAMSIQVKGHVTYLSVCQTGSSPPAALICNLTNTLCKCFSVIWMTVVFWELGLVHFLNAYRCNLSICMLSQNAEWVQIAVMKLFHYGDEQCWINRNNKAECFIEPSVEVLWQRVLLCLQLWWLAGGQRWLLAKWNNSNFQLLVIYKQS